MPIQKPLSLEMLGAFLAQFPRGGVRKSPTGRTLRPRQPDLFGVQAGPGAVSHAVLHQRGDRGLRAGPQEETFSV